MKKTNDTMKNLLGLNEEFVLDLDTQNENFSLNEDEDEDESAKDQPKKDEPKSDDKSNEESGEGEDESAKGTEKSDEADSKEVDDEGAKKHKHEPDVRSSELKTDLTELDNKVLNAQTAVDVANVLKLFLTKIAKDAAEQVK